MRKTCPACRRLCCRGRCTPPPDAAGDEEGEDEGEWNLDPEDLRRREACQRWQAAARSLMSSVHMVKHAETLANRFAHPADR